MHSKMIHRVQCCFLWAITRTTCTPLNGAAEWQAARLPPGRNPKIPIHFPQSPASQHDWLEHFTFCQLMHNQLVL